GNAGACRRTRGSVIGTFGGEGTDMRSISRLMRVPVLSVLAVFMAACGGGSAPATTSGQTQPIAKPTVAAAAPAAATTAPASAPAGALKSSKDSLTIVFQANQG